MSSAQSFRWGPFAHGSELMGILMVCGAFGGVVRGGTIHVPGDQPTIQAGINAAQPGDTVVVASGTYYENLVMKSGITLRSATGLASSVILEQSTAPTVPIMGCTSVGAATSIQGFTFRAALYTGAGGALRCVDSSPRVENCKFSANRSDTGGAVYCLRSAPTFTACVFYQNRTSREGGAMYLDGSSPTFVDCTFEQNYLLQPATYNGGAVYAKNASAPVFEDCTFISNTCAGSGGALYCVGSSPHLAGCGFIDNDSHSGGAAYLLNCTSQWDNCTLASNTVPTNGYVGGGLGLQGGSATLTGCLFNANTASAGGGVSCYSTNASFAGCTFAGNSATMTGGGTGGAVYCNGSPTFTGCTFNSNTANGNGGAVYCDDGTTATLADCTFTLNSAGGDKSGGAVYCRNGANIQLTDCLLDENSAGSGGGLFAYNASPILLRCILARNHAQQYGGATRFGNYCHPQIQYCTFYRNWVFSGGSSISAEWYSTFTVQNTIVAFDTYGEPVRCDLGSSVSLACCDVYGNSDGDYVGCIAGQNGVNGNLSADPLFWDPANNNFTIPRSSPCAPEQQPVCGHIGGGGIGCNPALPIVSNVRAQQNLVEDLLVYIRYDLSGGGATNWGIVLEVSRDGGNTWNVPVGSAEGDVGAGVEVGANRQIVWDPATDIQGEFGCDFVARITVDDGDCEIPGPRSDLFCVSQESENNHFPKLTRIAAVPRRDASRCVDIFFVLDDPDGDSCTVSLQVSDDGGQTWDVPTGSATGSLGWGVASSNRARIIWNPNADIPGETGNNYRARLTAMDGRGGARQGLSPTFSISNDPPEIPGDNGILRIGQLTITADSLVNESGPIWEATGNVMINNMILLTGTVTADTSTLMVKGSGEIRIREVPVLGDVLIYQGSWEFDAAMGLSNAINEMLTGFQVVGLDVEVHSIYIAKDEVQIQGRLVMPPLLNGAKLEISGEDYMALSRARGLTFSGATIGIPDIDGMALFGLPFSAERVSVHVTTDEVQIRGKLELPDLLEGTTVDLASDENHISITEEGGEPQVDVVGNLYMKGPIGLGGEAFSVEDVSLTLNTIDEILEGSGILNIPAGFGILMGIGFREGYFNYIEVGLTDMGIVIVATPPPGAVPIIYWQDVSAFMRELAPGPPPIVLGGAMAFTAGPQIDIGGESYYLARLEVGAEYDTGGRFTAEGQVLLGGGPKPFEFASAELILDEKYGMYAHGQMVYYLILTIDGAVRIDRDNNMQGKLRGSVKIPDSVIIIGGYTLGSVAVYGQYYDDTSYSNDYLAAQLRVRLLWTVTQTVKFNLNNGDIDWNASDDLVKEVEIPPGFRGSPPFDFSVASGVEQVSFHIQWDSGDTDLYLVRPDDTVITPENVGDYSDVMYFKSGDNREAVYLVHEPEAGTWQVDLSNTNGIGGYTIQEHTANHAPDIDILEPSTDVVSNSLTITWTDADDDDDASVALYYDNDRSGGDGTLIVDQLSEDNETDSYTWDVSASGVPTGAHYIYARIDDGKNAPFIDYSVGRIIVTDPLAPAAPDHLAAAAGPGSDRLDLTWTASGEVDHYIIGLTTDPAGEDYQEPIAAGADPESALVDLVPGQQYRLAVAAVNSNGIAGPFSEPVLLTPIDPVNNAPVFLGRPARQATEARLYQSSVPAYDWDGDEIAYELVNAPSGMTISDAGLLQWTPGAGQVGQYAFRVRLDDGHAGTNGLDVVIDVANANGLNRAPEILSQAPPHANPGTTYSYPVTAYDPDDGDSLTYTLLVGPAGATVNDAGLVEYDVPSGSARYDFLLQVQDGDGLYELKRFSAWADADAPLLDPDEWGTAAAVGVGSIEIEAYPVPDGTGLNEYRLDVDGVERDWQLSPVWSADAFLPNTAHDFRVKVRDASANRLETGWSNTLRRYTLAATPPAPVLVDASEHTADLNLSAGENPASTELALWNKSSQQWVGLDGNASDTEIWADAATWGTVQVQNLWVDTTCQFQVRARNHDHLETELSPVLAVKTDDAGSSSQVTPLQGFLCENVAGSTAYRITITAAFANDPFANGDLVYTWIVPTHPVTGKSLVLVSGGAASDSTATYAAPEAPAADVQPYPVHCIVSGLQTGNYVYAVVNVTVSERGDYDQDGDLDLDDFAHWEECVTGPQAGPYAPACGVFDLDPDGDVDLRDFAWLQWLLPGA